MKKLVLSLSLLFAVISMVAAPRHTERVDTAVVATEHLATPMKVTVILPQQALDNPDAKFPTVYLLNGYGGDYTNWPGKQPRLHELSNLYGMIIVSPDGRNSWYWDSPVDPKMQMETFFIEDLVPFIDANYPTIPQAEKRAISGLSMGGHGALWLSMRHSDVFKNAASMSGGVDIRPFKDKWKMKSTLGSTYDENPELWESHTVINLVPTLQNGQLNILVDCGNKDFFAEVNRNLHQELLKHGIDHDYIERPGVHNWNYWCNSVLYHLLFFNEQFSK